MRLMHRAAARQGDPLVTGTEILEILEILEIHFPSRESGNEFDFPHRLSSTGKSETFRFTDPNSNF